LRDIAFIARAEEHNVTTPTTSTPTTAVIIASGSRSASTPGSSVGADDPTSVVDEGGCDLQNTPSCSTTTTV
jgi:hypothetical protein